MFARMILVNFGKVRPFCVIVAFLPILTRYNCCCDLESTLIAYLTGRPRNMLKHTRWCKLDWKRL